MPITKCIVSGCLSTASTARLYNLPSNNACRAVWMRYLIPINPVLGSLAKNQLLKRKICCLHFEAKYIKYDGRRDVYCAPTLFTKEEIESGIPSKPLPSREPEKLLNEHSYYFKQSHNDHNYTQKLNVFFQDDDNLLDEPDQDNDCQFNDLDQDNYLTGIENLPDDDIAANADCPGFADEPEVSNEQLKRIPSQSQFTENHHRIKKFNEVQYFMDEFIKEIDSDIDYQAPEDPEPSTTVGKFADELKSYNFSSDCIMTNRYVKPYDQMENLMYSEKAYAAVTFCLLKQQQLFEKSIRDFLTWASKSEINYESLEKRVAHVFENGEFIQISLKILQIICKYRMKNIEIRKESIADQALEPEMQETLKKIPHSSTHLFNDDDLRITLESAPNISRVFLQNDKSVKIKIKSRNKHDRAIQVNILTKKADKTVQVKPKKVRKAGKCVQVNSNELECIATAKKVKKKDAGSQTSEKDKLLSTMDLHDNPPMRERSEIIDDSIISHCQKIQYVVNIKRKLPRHDGIRILDSKVNKGPHSLEPDVPAGLEHTNYPQSQNVQSIENRTESNNETSHHQDFHKKKKKCKSTKRAPEPSMPVLWDACQNLLSLGGRSNINETDSEQVHSTLERENVTPKSPKRPRRPNYGKKRRPKIPETLKEQSSPVKSMGTSPMRDTSESFQIPGRSSTSLHVCDSPYLLGGCKHTYDPQVESVPPSSVHRSQGIQTNVNDGHSRGKRSRYDIFEPSRSYNERVPRNSNIIVSAPVGVQRQNQDLTYDNLLSRWA